MKPRALLPILSICLLCKISVAKSDSATMWRSYTGINVVNDIAVGRHDVWFATDGGLVKFDKASKSWRRITIDNGLPALDIVAVSLSSRRQMDVYFIAVDQYSHTMLCRYSIASHKVAYVSIPFSSVYTWMNRLVLSYNHGKVSIIKLMPKDHVLIIECDSTFHKWREKSLSAKQQQRISARYSSVNLCAIHEVIPGGRWDYIICTNNIGVFDTKTNELRLTASSPYVRNIYTSVPFHFNANDVELRFERLDSSLIHYGIGVITYRRYLRSYLLKPKSLGIRCLGSRELSDSLANHYLSKMRLSMRSRADIGDTMNAAQIVSDGKYLWFAGNFHPRGFNTITKRWLVCHRFPNELPLGQNVLVNFQKEQGEPVVSMNGPYQYRFDRETDTWIRRKRSEFINRPRWLKVRLPSSPLPDAPIRQMQGLITAETQRYEWLIFGEGTITKSPRYPYPYIQAPARVDRTKGKTRFFHELWGYWAYRVIPYGEGDAWILAKKVSMNISQTENTILFRYDSHEDRLYRDDSGVFPDMLASEKSDKIDLVAASWGALLSLTYHGFANQDDQRLLMAWDSKKDQWRSISLPEGWRMLKTFGENDVLALLMVNPKGEYAIWFVNPANLSLSKLSMPARYQNCMPNDLFIGRRYLWIGGLYVIRVPISVVSAPQSR